jgi:hypothetical protein
MIDLTRLLPGIKRCPECDTINVRGFTHCVSCGARIVNRNPLVRLLVTVIAMAIVVGVIWWKLRR